LQSGDIIVAVDGREVKNEGWDSIKTQQDMIRNHQSGDIVRFQVQRGPGELEISVTRP
jgi:S1-C subfamily serine protease